MPLAPSFAGVILAAGASSRMGRDKALLPWLDGTFLSTAIRALQPLTDLVIVVAGANVADLEPVVNANAAFIVVNPNPERGQLSSLQTGLQEVLNRGRDAAIVTLVDRPAPGLATIEQVKDALLAAGLGTWAAIPEYGGRHGHPIVIGREMIESFLTAPVTASAREVEHAHQAKILYVPVTDALVVVNINTPDDLNQLQAGSKA